MGSEISKFILPNRISPNYTKLTAEVCTGKSKINSAKKLPLNRTQDLLWSTLMSCRLCLAYVYLEVLFHASLYFFGPGLFLESIEHDLMKLSKIQTDSQISTQCSQQVIRVDHKRFFLLSSPEVLIFVEYILLFPV